MGCILVRVETDLDNVIGDNPGNEAVATVANDFDSANEGTKYVPFFRLDGEDLGDRINATDLEEALYNEYDPVSDAMKYMLQAKCESEGMRPEQCYICYLSLSDEELQDMEDNGTAKLSTGNYTNEYSESFQVPEVYVESDEILKLQDRIGYNSARRFENILSTDRMEM